MRQRPFPTQSSILSSEAVLTWLKTKYRLPQPLACVFYKKGINDTYRLMTSRSSYYLRVYSHGWRNREEIEAEVDLLKALGDRGLPVSKPVSYLEGSYVGELAAPEGTRYAVLFTGAKGVQCVNPSKGQSYAFGEVAARMHNCVDRQRRVFKRFHIDTGHLIDEPLTSLRPFLNHRRKDLDFLRKIGDTAKEEVIKLPCTKPEYGVCHGDLHHWNVLFKQPDKLTLFDFDCFGYGWRAYDVSVFLWSRHWWDRDTEKRNRRWRAFLRGYQSERWLSRKELQSIPIFGAMRQIWLMGLHAAISKSWGWLDDDYFDRNIRFVRNWVKEYGVLK